MRSMKLTCIVVVFLLIGFLPVVASANRGGVEKAGRHIINLGGGGQYVFTLGGGGHYIADLSDVKPLVMPEGCVGRYEVELKGDGESNFIYLADDQYLNIKFSFGGGGQYGLHYTPRGGGGQYGVVLLPEGGGGQYLVLVVPMGGGGQYLVHEVMRGGKRQ